MGFAWTRLLVGLNQTLKPLITLRYRITIISQYLLIQSQTLVKFNGTLVDHTSRYTCQRVRNG